MFLWLSPLSLSCELVWPSDKALGWKAGPWFDPLRLSFLFKNCGLWTLCCDVAHTINETLKWLTQLPTLILAVTVWRVGVRYKIPDPLTSQSLISLNVFCGRKAQCLPLVELITMQNGGPLLSVVRLPSCPLTDEFLLNRPSCPTPNPPPPPASRSRD